MATDMVNALDTIIKEELIAVKQAMEPKVDGIFARMYTTSDGVQRQGRGIGRNFEVNHVFATGLSGAFKSGTPYGGDLVQTTGQATNYGGTLNSFPGYADVTAPGFVERTIRLVGGKGTFALPLHLLAANELNSTIFNAVALTIKGTAKKVTQSEAISFYKKPGTVEEVVSGGGGSAFIDIIDNTQVSDVATGQVQIDMSDSSKVTGRIGMLMPGMVLDHYDDTTKNNSVKLIVGIVDYINQTFDLFTEDGSAYPASGFDAQDYLVLWDSYGYGPSGLNDWMVSSGTVFGIDFTDYPQFKSSVTTSLGAALDEATLNEKIGKFYDAYDGMWDLDSAIMTAGVINGYMDNLATLFTYERNARKLNARGGWVELDYAYQGQNFDVLVSRYEAPGTCRVLKLGEQNLKRYVPPAVTGRGTRAEFNDEIQFYGPLAGSKSAFMPARDSNGAVAEAVEAPFYCWRECAPAQMPGVVIGGITEW